MISLSLRVDIDHHGRIGPGKIRLLEQIEALGSISAAGRSMNMSYKRAWALVDELNRCFGKPVVSTQMGGKAGGGAALTPFGCEVVAHYRAIENKAGQAASLHLNALQRAVDRPGDTSTDPPTDGRG